MLNLSKRLAPHLWSCVLGGYRYGDTISQSVANFVIGARKQTTWPAGQGDNTGQACVESSSEDCKRGTLYPIIYTQMLKRSTQTGGERAATASHLLSVLYSESSHPLDISTARSHLSNIFRLASLDICGLNIVWSSLLISCSSSNSFQTSTAKPAAMAAPSDVVSRIAGRSTGIPMRSAWVCGD